MFLVEELHIIDIIYCSISKKGMIFICEKKFLVMNAQPQTKLSDCNFNGRSAFPKRG